MNEKAAAPAAAEATVVTAPAPAALPRPVGNYALVRLLRRSMKFGALYMPASTRRTMKLDGEAAAPGLQAVGEVLGVSKRFELARPGLVGKYVVVDPQGGRGAHHGGDRVFYGVGEVLGVVEFDGMA